MNLISETDKPLVSFILIAYNQETFIREAVEGAFSQTYSPLEIILSDDCSPDSTFRVMQELVEKYDGPHCIRLNRNERNVGLASHVNIVMNIARGEILVLAGGDDISLPERAEKSQRILAEYPDLSCVSFGTLKFCNSYDLTVPDKIHSPKINFYTLDDLIGDYALHTNGAARAFRKTVGDYFDALLSTSPTEDTPIFLRSLILGRAAQVDEPMVYYRVHGNNLFASENKYNFDYDAIHEQYLNDIGYATMHGKLTEQEQFQVIASLEKRLVQNKIRNAFHHAMHKRTFFLLKVLPVQKLRLKQKLRYGMKAFLKKSFSIL